MKKNKIYVNKINKKIGNNQDYSNVKEVFLKEESTKTEIVKDDSLTINEKINQLLNRNGYIFNVNVQIITNKKEYNTKIAGKVNNHLITLDNEIINIDDIKDLVIKD